MSGETSPLITFLIDCSNSFLIGLPNCALDSLDGSEEISNSRKLTEIHFTDAQFAVCRL